MRRAPLIETFSSVWDNRLVDYAEKYVLYIVVPCNSPTRKDRRSTRDEMGTELRYHRKDKWLARTADSCRNALCSNAAAALRLL